MKKIIVLLLTVAFVFSLAACSQTTYVDKEIVVAVTDDNGQEVTDNSGNTVTEVIVTQVPSEKTDKKDNEANSSESSDKQESASAETDKSKDKTEKADAKDKSTDKTDKTSASGDKPTSGDNKKPSVADDKGASSKPNDTTKPNGTTNPNDTTKPNNTTKPNGTTIPNGTTKPSGILTSEASTSSAASDNTTKPSTTKKPPARKASVTIELPYYNDISSKLTILYKDEKMEEYEAVEFENKDPELKVKRVNFDTVALDGKARTYDLGRKKLHGRIKVRIRLTGVDITHSTCVIEADADSGTIIPTTGFEIVDEEDL